MSTITTSSSTQTSPLVIFTNFNHVKLTRDNDPLWLPQIVPHLRGENLFGYDDGTTIPHCLLSFPPLMVLPPLLQILPSYIGLYKIKSFLVQSIQLSPKRCLPMLHGAPPLDLPEQYWRCYPNLKHAPCKSTFKKRKLLRRQLLSVVPIYHRLSGCRGLAL